MSITQKLSVMNFQVDRKTFVSRCSPRLVNVSRCSKQAKHRALLSNKNNIVQEYRFLDVAERPGRLLHRINCRGKQCTWSFRMILFIRRNEIWPEITSNKLARPVIHYTVIVVARQSIVSSGEHRWFQLN